MYIIYWTYKQAFTKYTWTQLLLELNIKQYVCCRERVDTPQVFIMSKEMEQNNDYIKRKKK